MLIYLLISTAAFVLSGASLTKRKYLIAHIQFLSGLYFLIAAIGATN